MVFSAAFTSIANRFLSPFVDELAAEQLKIFGWSGKATISNVSIKPNAFDALKLPFRIVHGHIGHIEASVPWLSIYFDPIVITISDVYVFALPNSEISYNEEDEKNFEWQLKKSCLENIESVKQKMKEQGKKEEDDGFFMKLLISAVKNIQISVTNVHICYEDSSTNPTGSFQVGVSFSKLILQTDSARKSDNDNLIHKIAKLQGFAVYMNVDSQTKQIKRLSGLKASDIRAALKSQISTKGQSMPGLEYILCPFNFTAGAAIHRKPEADSYRLPIVEVTMHLDTFHLQLTNAQIKTALRLLEVLEQAHTAARYRKWKPADSIREKPLAWWKFYFTASLETGVLSRKREFAWSAVEECCKKRALYTELYKQKLLEEKVNVPALEALEKELKLTSIVYARSQAELETVKLLESRQKKGKPATGWFAGWFSADKDAKANETLAYLKKEFTQEEKEKLYKAIDYKEDTHLHLFPADFIAHRLAFNAKMFRITVKNEEIDALKVLFENNRFLFLNRPASANIYLKCQLDSLTIIGKNEVMLMREKEIDRQFIDLTFEWHPLDKQSDMSVSLLMKSSYLLYDIATINELYQMARIDSVAKASIEKIESYAQHKLIDLKEQTTSGIESALEEQKQLKLDIHIEPSFVIVPQGADIVKANFVVLLSLGKLTLTSTLLPKTNIGKLRAMEASKVDRKELIEEMIKLVYEKYRVHIENVQLVLSDATHWREDIDKLDTERHMLCPFEVMIDLGISLVPKDVQFAKMQLTCEIPQIEVKASDPQISQLMSIFATLPYGPSLAESQQHTTNASPDLSIVKIANDVDDVADAVSFATKAAKSVVRASKEALSVKVEERNPPKATEESTQQNVNLTFKLKSLCLCLFSSGRAIQCALGRIQLIKLTVSIEILDNGKMLINSTIVDLQLCDLRSKRTEKGIRILFSGISAEREVTPLLALSIEKQLSNTAIILKMSGFKYIVALDFTLTFIDVAMKAFTLPVDLASSLTKVSLTQLKPPGATAQLVNTAVGAALGSTEAVTTLTIDMNKMEILAVESLDVLNAVACVFNCLGQVSLRIDSQQTALTVNVWKINMGVANYLAYTQNDKLEEYILLPTDLELTGTINASKQTMKLALTDICITISPQMLNALVGIFASLGSSSSNQPAKGGIQPRDTTEGLLTSKPINGSICWYLKNVPNEQQVVVAREMSSSKIEEEERKVLELYLPVIKVFIKSLALNSLRFSKSLEARMVNGRRLSLKCTIAAENYNPSFLAWEPFIEPLNEKPFLVEGDIDFSDGRTNVRLNADRLEVLLSKSSISTLNNIISGFSSALTAKKASLEKIQENRVTVRNLLGIPIAVDMSKSNVTLDKTSLGVIKSMVAMRKSAISLAKPSDRRVSRCDSSKMSSDSKVINFGEECHFIAENLAKVELLVTLKFSDSVVIQRKLLCSNSSLRCYFTSIKTYPVNENWKWIVEVTDSGLAKEIEFRSNTQIVNNFDCSFLLYSYDNLKTTLVGQVDPSSDFFLPLDLIYSETLLFLRPTKDFKLSDVPVDWRSIDLKNQEASSESLFKGFWNRKSKQQAELTFLVLSCEKKADKKKKFFVKVRGEKFPVLYEDTERLDNDEAHVYNIKLIPFARLKNLLPYSIEFSYDPIDEVVKLSSGEDVTLPYVIFGTSKITYRLLDYLGRNWTCSVVLPETGQQRESRYLTFNEVEGRQSMCLAINHSVESNTLNLIIHAPFWMVNQTQHDVTYRVDNDHVYVHPRSLITMPYLLVFDPSSVAKKDKLSLAIANSAFSDYFPLNVAPYRGSVLPQAASKKYAFYVNVRIELARITMSKIVTISSFFNVHNISLKDVEYSEDGEVWWKIESQSSKAFFPTSPSTQTVCFRLAGAMDSRSKFISLRDSTQTLLPIGSRLVTWLFVEVVVTEFKAKIKISDYFYGASPVLLVNNLEKAIVSYGQKGLVNWEKEDANKTGKLLPKHRAFFCWPEPGPDLAREFVFCLGGQVIQVDLLIDKCQSLKLAEGVSAYYVTFFDEKQRVLLFTSDPTQAQYLLRAHELKNPNLIVEMMMEGLGVNLVNSEQRKDLLYLSISSSTIWEERASGKKAFKSLSPRENAIIEEIFQEFEKAKRKDKTANPLRFSQDGQYKMEFDGDTIWLHRPREVYLRRQFNGGLWLKYSKSAHLTQYRAKVNRIQVDNQLPDHIYDVVFSPVIVPKSISDTFNLKQNSFIEVVAVIQSLGLVTRYQQLEVLIQEFMVQVDLGWINQIMGTVDFETIKEDTPKMMIAKDLETMNKNKALTELQKSILCHSYYDHLMLGPLKAHISVSLGDLPGGRFPIGLDLIIRFTGLTIGEINDSLLKLDCFERNCVFMSDTELVSQITQHYKTQVFAQLYKLILGMDIIGNPMKLALGIQKGIGDFFYEPALGFVQGPEEFAEGLATGMRSLATGVIGGTAGALGRIGNRLGTGVAALSADEKFQKERRERLNRKPGFWESGKNLFSGFAAGITGLVTKPLEGCREDGVEGLFKGVGQGFMGVITQPVTGVIDFASGSLNAFNEVIDPKQVAKPVRPPRYFPPFAELTPYNLYTAQGNQLTNQLEDGKYAQEEYCFHVQLSSKSIVLLTKLKIFYLKQAYFGSNWESDWLEIWSNVQDVTPGKNKLRIQLKGTPGILCFSGPNERVIADSNGDNILALYTAIERILKPQ